MALKKVNYIDKQTVISAKNMNDIQDAIIDLENNHKVFTDTSTGKKYKLYVDNGKLMMVEVS